MYKLKFSTGNKAVNRSVAGAVGSGLAAWNANYVVLLVPYTEKRKKVPENYPCWGQLDLNSFQQRLRLFYPMKTRWPCPCGQQGNPSTSVWSNCMQDVSTAHHWLYRSPGGASGPSIFLNAVQDQVRTGGVEGEVQRNPGAKDRRNRKWLYSLG